MASVTPKAQPLVVVVGETASGKSALATELARRFGGEIVSADAWNVYEEFDVGTAKPGAAERSEIPHHMINVTTADDGYSAAVFKKQATEVISAIAGRGKVPILVGGTGLYIDSILYDYGFLPAPNLAERAALNTKSIEELLEEARHRGLATAAVDVRNKRRIIRLLENNGAVPTKQSLRPDTLIIGLRVPREALHERIVRRVDAMFAAGLADEVEQLAKRYGWAVEPMKGIGYREFREYFDGTQTIEQTRDRIVAGTMRLAKKQRTWFGRNKSIQWVDDQEKAVDLVTTFLNKYRI